MTLFGGRPVTGRAAVKMAVRIGVVWIVDRMTVGWNELGNEGAKLGVAEQLWLKVAPEVATEQNKRAGAL